MTKKRTNPAGGVLFSFRRAIERGQKPWHQDHGAFEQRGFPMPTFMCFLNWTDQGAKAVKEAPQRYEMLKGLITGLGGRLVSAYVTTGQYDVAVTVEMPNGDAMTKLSVALSSRGFVRTTTVRAFTPEEFGKLAAEAP